MKCFKSNIYNYSIKTLNTVLTDIKTLQNDILQLPTNTNISNLESQIDDNNMAISLLVVENQNQQTQINQNTNDILDRATTTYVDQQIANLVNSAPETLDTLGEIASQLNNNELVSTAIITDLATKASTSYVDTSIENLEISLDTRISQNELDISNNITSITDLDTRVTQNTTDISNFNNLSIGTVTHGINETPNVELVDNAFNFVLKDGITPTFHINDVTSGDNPNVVIDPLLTTESDIYLNFELKKGDKGDKGDKGSNGDGVGNSGGGDSFLSGVIGGVAGSTISLGAIATTSALQSAVDTLADQLDPRLIALESKTQNQSANFTQTNFFKTLNISPLSYIGDSITFNPDGSNTIPNNTTFNDDITTKNITNNDTINSNKLITDKLSVDSNINTPIKFGSHSNAYAEACISFVSQLLTSNTNGGTLNIDASRINLNSSVEITINAPMVKINALTVDVNGLLSTGSTYVDQFGGQYYDQFSNNFDTNDFFNQFV